MSCSSPQNRIAQRRRGFTLVELMVVIVIIGMLAAAATVGVRGYLMTSRRNIARLDVAKIVQAIDTYYTVFSRYPTIDEGIEVLAEPNDKFPDGILSHVPKDPWGNPYAYFDDAEGVPYEVLCYGADGRQGGEGEDADISSMDLSDDPAAK